MRGQSSRHSANSPAPRWPRRWSWPASASEPAGCGGDEEEDEAVRSVQEAITTVQEKAEERRHRGRGEGGRASAQRPRNAWRVQEQLEEELQDDDGGGGRRRLVSGGRSGRSQLYLAFVPARVPDLDSPADPVETWLRGGGPLDERDGLSGVR